MRASHTTRRIFFSIALVAGAVSLAVPASLFVPSGSVDAATKTATTATKVKPYAYERIFYSTGTASAKASLFAHPDQIDIFAPQAYTFDSGGALTGTVDPTIMAFTQAHGIKVMPLAVNNGFSSSAVSQFLKNETSQDSAIDEMVATAKVYGYAGWQLDFEQMDASNRDAFTAFVQRFGTIMKQNGLMSSVAVVAETGGAPSSYPNNLWQKLIGVYDYAGLGKSVDFLSVMSYDDPNSKGPIVEYSWLKQVLAYTLSVVPASKVSLGVPLYYWQWNEVNGKLVAIGGEKGLQTLFNKHYIKQSYSVLQQEPYLTYTSYGVHYTVWFENWQSMQKKLALVTADRLRGFSAWTLGIEAPSVWEAIRKGK